MADHLDPDFASSIFGHLNLTGVEETATSVTDIGKGIEQFEVLVQKMQQVFGSFDQSLTGLSERVDKATDSLNANVKRVPTMEEQAQAEEQKKQQEETQLRAKMAQMVGGGVNYAAYTQQIDKVKAQIEMINKAQESHIITGREALLATSKLTIQMVKLKTEAAAYAAVGGGALGRIAASVTQKLMATPENVMGAAKSQVAGIGTGVMGLISSTIPGGGLFGLMMHGVMNADRIKAETGEITNIASAAGGTLTNSMTGYLGSFQQKAEHLYGISRGDLQGVLKTFVDAGVSINDIMKKQSGSLGEVGHDIMSLTLGIDRHFEMANGTSAKIVVSLMTDYGQGVKEAGDLYEKLAFAGARSGMGTQNFLNAVMQGAGSLRQYGVGVEGVATTLVKLQERYESMGMPKQLAGTQATMALGQISQGIGGMSTTMQAYMGERMGMGHGMEARMNFRDGVKRLSQDGGSNQMMGQTVSELYKVAMEAGGGDKTQARYFLEQQGMGFEGAKGIVEIGDKIEKGGGLQNLSIEEQKKLRDAFKTEGQKTSDIQKNMYGIMRGMADVGQGIMQIVSNFIAIAIVFFKTMPTLLMGSEAEKKATYEKINEFYKGIAEGANKMYAGGTHVVEGMMNQIRPIIGPLQDAIGWSPYGGNTNVKMWEVSQAGLDAEKSMVQADSMHIAGTALRNTSMELAKSGHTGLAQAADDGGALLQGASLSLGRIGSSLFGLATGHDKMDEARADAEAKKTDQIKRQGQDSAKKTLTEVHVEVHEKQAHRTQTSHK